MGRGWREKHGWRCTDPETGEKRILFDDAKRIQEERTPGVLPVCPKRPEGIPKQKWPLFKNDQVRVEPMKVPEFSLLREQYDLSRLQLTGLKRDDDDSKD